MAITRRLFPTGRVLLCIAGTLAGLLLFARGFFPVKPFIPGYSRASRPASHSRLVFVLVDAPRSDFAFGPESSMPFVGSLVASGHGIPFTALAQSPTVTLPRLKVLTTGSNPTFLDAITNIAEDSDTAVLENVDSWVRQLAIGKDDEENGRRKIVFAGDDTWLRLFPNAWFEWAEGVSSFFVADPQTVDSNVTRHLGTLLGDDHAATSTAPPDWDVLILHFLGLDHIGHLGGPNSPLMAPKQKEMDDVIKRLFEYLRRKDADDGRSSLLVLVGDHGMSETGNHGGSTEGKTAAALLFASPALVPFAPLPETVSTPGGRYHLHQVVNQIDLVPTLSVLLGLGIPMNSMGRIIESVVQRWPPGGQQDISDLLRENADQITRVLAVVDTEAPDECRCEALNLRESECFPELQLDHPESISKYLSLAQRRLLDNFGDHDVGAMAGGLVILLATALGFTLVAHLSDVDNVSSALKSAILGAFVAYLGSFFTTTFLEEEHELWLFFTATGLLLIAMRRSLNRASRTQVVLTVASIRVMRSWSQNGQKAVPNFSLSARLAKAPTFAAWSTSAVLAFHIFVAVEALVKSARGSKGQGAVAKQLLVRAASFAVLLTLVLVYTTLVLVAHLREGATPGFILAALRELDLDGPVTITRAGYGVATLAFAVARLVEWVDPSLGNQLAELKLSVAATFLASLTRTENLPLFILLWSQYRLLKSLPLNPLLFSAIIIAFQRTSYFSFGGSNSLATVDLLQAYNGVESYDVRLVSLQTFLSNFAGPIFWSLATPSLLLSQQQHTPASPIPPTCTSHFLITSSFHAWVLFTLAASATHFRHHLFTFTVFSPALIFQGVWSTWVHLGSDVVLAQVMQ